MNLLLLGTSGYHPSAVRQTACLMVPELGIVLDAGTGMFRAREHLQTEALDIFLSHSHLDHVIGLTYLFSLMHETPLKTVRVHGTPETLAAVQEHLFARSVFPVQPPFEACPLADESPLPGGGRLTHFPLAHPGGARGFRLDWPGHSLAYVTDTTAHVDAEYVSAIRGVDLLVHECFFNDDMPEKAELTGHSCTTPTAEVARAAGVGRLVLTHLNPLAPQEMPIDLALARSIFPQTEIGRDAMRLEF